MTGLRRAAADGVVLVVPPDRAEAPEPGVDVVVAGGATRSAAPLTMSPELGQGARKLKSYMLAGGEIEMKPVISGRRIRSCIPIHAPNEKPAIQHCGAFSL